MSESRRDERVKVDWRVCFRCPDWNAVSRVVAENASRGGLFLLAAKPPKVGSRIALTIELPDGSELHVAGSVAHVVTPERAAVEGRSAGFGVQIDEPHHTDFLLLEQMALAAGAAPSPSQPLELAPPRVAPPPAPERTVRGRGAKDLSAIAGIDLGSTYASIAFGGTSGVALVADDQGRTRHPTMVSFPEGRPPVVGWRARARLAEDPRRTVTSARRLLGKRATDPQVSAWLYAQAFATASGDGDALHVDLDGARVDVPRVCAAVLGHLRGLAEHQLDREVTEVMLAVPASFNGEERAALEQASALAGLEIVELIPEPLAAARAAGAGQNGAEIVGVYDFGGARFDFTLLEMAGGRGRMVACAGDALLGGDDLDQSVAQWVAEAMKRATGVELRRRVGDWHRLVLACEEARRALSTSDVASVRVAGVDGVELSQRLERGGVERMAAELIERSLGCCRKALASAGLQADAVDRMVVVGGMAQMPAINGALNRFFARTVEPIARPDEAISRGLAMVGASVAGIVVAAS